MSLTRTNTINTRIVSTILSAITLFTAVQAHAASGKEVDDTTCIARHGTGAAGGAALHGSALKGKGVMPAKGGDGGRRRHCRTAPPAQH